MTKNWLQTARYITANTQYILGNISSILTPTLRATTL